MCTHTPENQHLADLLGRVARHDHQAFAQLYDLTSGHLHGVALRYLRSRPTADEVLQEAFVNVWLQAGSYASTLSTPMTWLISVVRNKAVDHLRKTKNEVAHGNDRDDSEMCLSEQMAEDGDPLELLGMATDARALNRCVAQLDAAQRQSLVLAFNHGLSHSELAEHLRVPLGTAKAWVRRGLTRLRACLECDRQSAGVGQHRQEHVCFDCI